jgi:hypothetical protein
MRQSLPVIRIARVGKTTRRRALLAAFGRVDRS